MKYNIKNKTGIPRVESSSHNYEYDPNQKQAGETVFTNLETENKKLKDDYTYALKRILLNRNDFCNNNYKL